MLVGSTDFSWIGHTHKVFQSTSTAVKYLILITEVLCCCGMDDGRVFAVTYVSLIIVSVVDFSWIPVGFKLINSFQLFTVSNQTFPNFALFCLCSMLQILAKTNT